MDDGGKLDINTDEGYAAYMEEMAAHDPNFVFDEDIEDDRADYMNEDDCE